jgi:hypothetical protein
VPDLLTAITPGTVIALLLGILLFALVLIVVLQLLGALCQGALIRLVDAADRGQLVRGRDGWQAGVAGMWRLFLIALLVFSPFIVTILLFAGVAVVPFVAALVREEPLDAPHALTLIGVICLAIPALCSIVVIGFLLGILAILAQRAVILQDLGATDSIRRAWGLLRERFWQLVLMSLIWLALSIVVGMITAVPALVLAVPFIAIFQGEVNAGLMAVFVVLLLAYIVYAIAVATLYAVFSSALWTLTYRRITGWLPQAAPAPLPAI